MDFIDLTKSPETSHKLPEPLISTIENFEGRLSIGGDPFEKAVTEAKLHNDPFELRKQKSPQMSLMTNFSDLEMFLLKAGVSPLDPINNTFVNCDISPIMNASNNASNEQCSALNKGFLQLSGKQQVDEQKSQSGTDSDKLWHSIVTETQEDLTAITPPPLVDACDAEDSLEDLKIPILDHIVDTHEETPDDTTQCDAPATPSALESSAVVENLRRRMKDFLNKKIPSNQLDVPTERQFNIDTSTRNDESFMETLCGLCGEMDKLTVECDEHNVSIVQDASQMEENKSMVVVLVNGENSVQHKRSNASGTRRSTATSGWKSPVGLPSPNFRGPKIRAKTKSRATVQPMRAIRSPQQMQQMFPPEQKPKRRSPVITETPKPRTPVSTPHVPADKFVSTRVSNQRDSTTRAKKLLGESNSSFSPRYSKTPSK